MLRQSVVWGTGAIISYFGFMASWLPLVVEEGDWISFIERLGVPTAFLLALIYMLWKGAKTVWPFFKEQVERLVDVPHKQLEIERKERKDQQKRYEDVILVALQNQTESNNQVASVLKDLTEAINNIRRNI